MKVFRWKMEITGNIYLIDDRVISFGGLSNRTLLKAEDKDNDGIENSFLYFYIKSIIIYFKNSKG